MGTPRPTAASTASADGSIGTTATTGESMPGSLLTPHHAHCLGCGPDNPAGLHLRVYRSTSSVFTDVVFDERHRGAPGLAHGGAISVACDALFGFLLYAAGQIAVTRTLTVEYLMPVALGEPIRITARAKYRRGRRLYFHADGTGSDCAIRFAAKATFVAVDVEHFRRHGESNEIDALLGAHPMMPNGRR